MQPERRLVCGLVAAGLLATTCATADVASAQVQYDYDAVGRLCRARLSNGDTVNYRYDKNGNRTVAVQAKNGGETTSAACPAPTSVGPSGPSAARSRDNHLPIVIWGPNNLEVDAHGAGPCGDSGVPCPGPVKFKVFLMAFDLDLDPVSVHSAVKVFGLGQVSLQGDTITIKQPMFIGEEPLTARIDATVTDGRGGNIVRQINVTYVPIDYTWREPCVPPGGELPPAEGCYEP